MMWKPYMPWTEEPLDWKKTEVGSRAIARGMELDAYRSWRSKLEADYERMTRSRGRYAVTSLPFMPWLHT